MNHEKEQSLYGDHHTNAGTVFHLSHIFLFKRNLLQLYRLERIRNLGFRRSYQLSETVGGRGYRRCLQVYAICATILVNIISLLLALALNAKIKCKNALKAIYFLPYMLSALIVSFVFNFIFSNVLPDLGQKMGIGFLSSNILGQENLAWVGILVVGVWQAVAFNTIIYMSGLQTVDTDIYEASSIDGAGRWTTFWKMTFPLIAPFFTINMVLCVKNFLMVFDQIIAMTNGGPGTSTQSISVLIYKQGFSGAQYAYQSANAVIFFIVIAVISLFQTRVLEKREA